MLFGSDFPYIPPALIEAGVRELRAFPEFDVAARERVERVNALDLLK